jgi:hypothetical protein
MSGCQRRERGYFEEQGQEQSERTEGAEARVFHDCERALAPGSTCESIESIGQPVFMQSAGERNRNRAAQDHGDDGREQPGEQPQCGGTGGPDENTDSGKIAHSAMEAIGAVSDPLWHGYSSEVLHRCQEQPPLVL